MSETATMTLTEFLLARVAEDEATARRVSDPISGRDDLWSFDGPFDPDRVLAECEAKRRIVEQYRTAVTLADEAHPAERFPHGIVSGYEAALRALALPYADHPDYDEEWKP